jgi:hypothetical protein
MNQWANCQGGSKCETKQILWRHNCKAGRPFTPRPLSHHGTGSRFAGMTSLGCCYYRATEASKPLSGSMTRFRLAAPQIWVRICRWTNVTSWGQWTFRCCEPSTGFYWLWRNDDLATLSSEFDKLPVVTSNVFFIHFCYSFTEFFIVTVELWKAGFSLPQHRHPGPYLFLLTSWLGVIRNVYYSRNITR